MATIQWTISSNTVSSPITGMKFTELMALHHNQDIGTQQLFVEATSIFLVVLIPTNRGLTMFTNLILIKENGLKLIALVMHHNLEHSIVQ